MAKNACPDKAGTGGQDAKAPNAANARVIVARTETETSAPVVEIIGS